MEGFILFLALIVILIFFTIYYALAQPTPECKARMQGHSEEEKSIIKYFLDNTNCAKSAPFTASQYDQKVKQSIPANKISQVHALEVCNIDESEIMEVEPIHLSAYYFDSGCLAKRSEVGSYQSSKYQHTWLFFTKDQLHIYQYVRNMETSSGVESTLEFFYKDITSFSTSSDSIEKKISTTSGSQTVVNSFEVESEVFKIVVPGDSLKCAMTGSDEIRNSVKAMNALLREKKNV